MKMHVKKPTQQEIESTAHWGTWSKEPSVFPWSYEDKETCYILEGAATVTDSEGRQISFKRGDWVVFEPGLSCTWKITETIKKKYMFG